MAHEKPIQLVVMVGSLRRGSFNAAIARALPVLAPDGVTITPLSSIGDFPLYNFDLQQEGFPPVVTAMGEAIRKADGLIIVTPEYNYSIPGVLKNALDWASRPAFTSVMAYKPVAIMATSRGALGGARCLEHLRVALDSMLSRVALAREVIITPRPRESRMAGSSTRHVSASPAARSRRCCTRSAFGGPPRLKKGNPGRQPPIRGRAPLSAPRRHGPAP